jgi:L1 cell adhesion molecule like protein
LNIFEGERARTEDNHRVGSLQLRGISRKHGEDPDVTVEFHVDACGVLHVTAKCAGVRQHAAFSRGLPREEIDRLARKALQDRSEEDAVCKRIVAKNALEDYCLQMRSSVSDAVPSELLDAINEALDWLEHNPLPTKEACAAKQKSIEGLRRANMK